MTIRLFLLAIILACTLFPAHGEAAVEMRSLEVQFSFDASAVPDKTLAGYKLYQNAVEVCSNADPAATSLVCQFASEAGTHIYELTAYYTDNTESPKSPPFQFTIGTSLPPVGTTPPPDGSVGSTPPPATGDYLVSYSWDATTDATRAGYRMYLNDTMICETADPKATTLSCYADLVNAVMRFSIASYDASGTESLRSNFLTLDPVDFPELFQKKLLTFNWDYTDAVSSAGGFQVFNNGTLLCSTTDPTAKSLQCTLDTLLPQHTFAMAAVNAAGELTTISNAIVYTGSAGSTVPPPATGTLTAAISPSTTKGTAPLAIAFSATGSTGPIATYTWDFGDGDTGKGSTISHTYAVAGTYSVTLAVSDSSGNNALANVTVTADQAPVQLVPPTAIISSSAASGEAPLSVTFDGTGSSAKNSIITSYNWDFGDGTKGTGPTASHTFTIAGTYNTQLLVTDSNGLTDTVTTPVLVSPATIVNKAPTASFTATPTQGTTPLTVSFNGSGSNDSDGTISSYVWNFGDGSSATGQTASHTYTTAATYTATLQVTDNQGGKGSTSVAITAKTEEPTTGVKMETGEVMVSSEWVRVPLITPFTNPVVIAGPPSFSDSEPCVIRLRNVNSTGFDIRLTEWDYQDGVHPQESVSYLVMEQGRHTLPNGSSVEAGTYAGTIFFKTVPFSKPFAKPPVVLTTIASFNETDTISGRIRNVSTSSFDYYFREQEKNKNTHVKETVNFIAWEPGTGTTGLVQFEASATDNAVTHAWYSIAFQTATPHPPLLLADMQTTNAGDTSALRVQQLSGAGFQVKVEEEQSKDSEVNHGGEIVGYLAFNQPEKKVLASFTWDFDAALEATINGFQVLANGEVICTSEAPTARQLNCEMTMPSGPTAFTIQAMEKTGSNSAPSNGITYTP